MTYGNASHTVDFDGSSIYLLDNTVWCVPAALQIAQWKNIIAIFSKKLWLAIFVTFLGNGIAWWILGSAKTVPADLRGNAGARGNAPSFTELTLCLLHSMYCLLQGSITAPREWKLRVVFIIWLIISVLIFSAYQSSLVSYNFHYKYSFYWILI